MEDRQLSRTDNCIDEQMELYGDMVFRIGILYLRKKEDAEDVFQEVFLKLFSARTEFASEEHQKAWLITTTVNQCKNVLRSVRRKKEAVLDELCAAAEAESGGEESELVRELLGLPIKYRRVLFLYYYEGYKSEEIGEMLHISPATVRTQMRRGRELLKCGLLKGEAI